MSIKQSYEKGRELLRGALKTPRGKDVVTYLVFVVVAFVFWLLLSLDSEVERDYDVPLEIENIPDSVTLISTMPPTINVSVKAKGAMLMRYSWGKIPTFKLNFHEFLVDENTWSIPSEKLESKMRDYFASGTTIKTIRPDSLRLIYTALPGEKIPLEVNIEAVPNMQCVISGPITANVDSVMAYSPYGSTHFPAAARTEHLVKRNLKDTTIVEVRIRPVGGIRFIPDHVTVKIPVEPLISKRHPIVVKTANLPDGHDVIPFPSKVEVSYLLPMSRYHEDFDIYAYIDYSELARSRHKAALHISELPSYISNVILKPDSVEYVIETND